MVRDLCSKGSIAELFACQNLVADLNICMGFRIKSLGFASLLC